MGNPLKLSIVIPAYNEESNIEPLLEKLSPVVTAVDFPIEVIIVDDGSTDNTLAVAQRCATRYNFVKVISQPHMGLTPALIRGFEASTGDVFMFLPADLQVMPDEIPKFMSLINSGYDIVCAWYHPIKPPPLTKSIASKIYNALSRKMFGIPVHHMNSAKAIRRTVMENIPLRPDWHRYIVAIAHTYGYKVGEVKVTLYPRHSGKSKFGFWRIPVGVLDLIAVKLQLKFLRKPLLFFGLWGGISLLIGIIVGIVALYMRFILHHGLRVLAYPTILFILAGLILITIGIFGELTAGLRDELRILMRKLDRLTK